MLAAEWRLARVWIIMNERNFVMTSWYGNAFRINSPLWWESIGPHWIPFTKGQQCGALRSLNNLLDKQSNLRRNDIMWRHCNDHHDHVYHIPTPKDREILWSRLPSPPCPGVYDLGRSCHYIKTTSWFVSKFGSICCDFKLLSKIHQLHYECTVGWMIIQIDSGRLWKIWKLRMWRICWLIGSRSVLILTDAFYMMMVCTSY